MTATTLPHLYLVSEAAEKARVSEWMIRHEIKAGRLKARRIGRTVRILEDDLAAFIRGDAGDAGGAA